MTDVLRNQWQLGELGGVATVDLRRPAQPERPVTIDALPAMLTFDLGRTAILVIDMQNDFCSPDGWLAGIGVDVAVLNGAATAIAALLPHCRAAGMPVVWLNWGNRVDQANLPPGVRHVYDPVGAGTGIGALMPNGSRVLTAGSWGASVIDELTASDTDIWVDKYRMSGFYDTALDSVLRNLRVDTLLFTGVNSDQCVYATLIDAACLGYDVVLIEDACATTSPAYCHEATLYNTRQCFGLTASASAVLTGVTQQASGPEQR